LTLRVCGAPAPEIHGDSRRCLVAAGECETKPILDAPDSQQSRDQLVSKIAHLHSAELVDWAQRSLPIKNRLTPNLSKYRKFVSRHSPFAQRY